MKEIAIKRHSFDLAKNRLKEFSETTEAELEIGKVRTDGGFLGLGAHKVTGDELNERLKTIQEHFISVNTTNNKVIKEFREIYNALDVLDKDYITSIVANVKAIEKTSNDVRVQQGTLKQHNEKLANQQSKLDAHQVEIEKNVANISKIVTALKVFKEKLEGYEHLTDIDKIWNDCKAIQNEIRIVSDGITKFSKKATEEIATANNKNKALLDQVNRDILKMQKHLEEIDSFVAVLDDYTHLQDIDNMWDDLDICKTNIERINGNIQTQQSELDNLATTSEEHTDKLNELEQADGKMCESIDTNAHDISLLKEYKDKLSEISHLDDVDYIWQDVEEHTSKLIEREKRDEELAATIRKNKEEANENIAEAVQTANAAIETLTKKVKYAYWIAGGSAGLAIIELILLLMKVI